MAKPKVLPLHFCAGGRQVTRKAELRAAQMGTGQRLRRQRGRPLALPGADGNLAGYLFGTGGAANCPVLVAGLAAAALEPGRYRAEGDIGDPTLTALAFRPGAYRFDRYRRPKDAAELVDPVGADMAEVDRLATGATLARDLINIAGERSRPDDFDREIRFAAARKMKLKAITGDDLLKHNFRMIHAVGRAGHQPPRLLDLTWGREVDPKVTLVGKGVTFDTGGLDIKPPPNMLLMKKDKGGAANILGLAHAVVDAKLKVRLRVLIPIVENAIAGDAFRPGDVLTARNGTRWRSATPMPRGGSFSPTRCRSPMRRPRTRHRHGDAHRRGPHRARPRPAAPLYGGRRAGRRPDGGRCSERRSASGACRSGRHTSR